MIDMLPNNLLVDAFLFVFRKDINNTFFDKGDALPSK